MSKPLHWFKWVIKLQQYHNSNHIQQDTHWSYADAVSEQVISLDLFEALTGCPWPHITNVESLIQVGHTYTQKSVNTENLYVSMSLLKPWVLHIAHTCTHECTHTCMQTHMCTHMHTHAHTHTHTHTHACTCTSASMHAHTQVAVWIRMTLQT